jgi:hypothetical protein
VRNRYDTPERKRRGSHVLRRVANALRLCVLAGLLGGCAFVDIVDPRYDSINRSTAKARNESILLNIVRASHSAPLNFIAFSKVSGQTIVTANAGMPQFNIGSFFPVFGFGNSTNLLAPPTPQRAFTVANNTLGGSTNANNAFDISVLETKDFYNGLLRPVDLPELLYFIRQGYSRELLFWLFTESVRVTSPGQPTVEFLNDPDPRLACQMTPMGERCFSHMVDIAIASGLTVETRTETVARASTSGGSGAAAAKSGSKSGPRAAARMVQPARMQPRPPRPARACLGASASIPFSRSARNGNTTRSSSRSWRRKQARGIRAAGSIPGPPASRRTP